MALEQYPPFYHRKISQYQLSLESLISDRKVYDYEVKEKKSVAMETLINELWAFTKKKK